MQTVPTHSCCPGLQRAGSPEPPASRSSTRSYVLAPWHLKLDPDEAAPRKTGLRGLRHLQVAMRCGGLIDSEPFSRVLFFVVHEVARDGAAARVHRGFPEQHQGRVPDLTECQVIGRA